MLRGVHQHIWTVPLIDCLAAREHLLLIRRSGALTVLHSAGEHPCVIDMEAEAPDRRAELVRADGLDLALVAISSPIGIEALPRDAALELIDAHLHGVTTLPGTFAPWGPLALDRAEPDDVDALLGRGCIGISIPAGAPCEPDRLETIGPVLERCARHRAPVFVHPGPGTGGRARGATLGEPLWWQALTSYVAQMQAAWSTFASFGRRAAALLVLSRAAA